MEWQAKKTISYAVDQSSEDEDDQDIFKPSKAGNGRGRPTKRRKTRVESEDDKDFAANSEAEDIAVDEGRFIELVSFILNSSLLIQSS